MGVKDEWAKRMEESDEDKFKREKKESKRVEKGHVKVSHVITLQTPERIATTHQSNLD